MHIRMAHHSRVERTTTSCGECRRRKQRCNQGRPCSNCARRFPQPACEYRATIRRQIGPSQYGNHAASGSPLPAIYAGDFTFRLSAAFDPFIPQTNPSPLPAQWAGNPCLESDDVIGWSGIDLLTQVPPSTSSGSQWSFPWPPSLGASVPLESSPGVGGSLMHAGKAHAAVLETPEIIHDPSLNGGWQPDGGIDSDSWFSLPNRTLSREGSPLPAAGSPSEGLSSLLAVGMTQQSPDLLRIFVRTIAPFSAALDGNSESSNGYIRHYVPLCLQNTLLTHTAMYTAACFLNETGQLDSQATMAHKSEAINMLNESLWTDLYPSDETVAAHTQLILNEWYWGGGTDLGAHLRGLKEMVRLRGGFRCLGLHGLVAKMAITADVSIALCNEAAPVLQCTRQIEPLENTRVPLRLALNTPLVSTLPRFADCAEALKLDAATAAILDDMRFLVSAVLALPDGPSEKELQKINTTSAWIHNRTLALPDHPPRRSTPPPHPPPTARSATAPSIIVTDIEASFGTDAEPSSMSARRGSWHSVHSSHSAASSDQAYSDQSAEDRLPNPSHPHPIPHAAPLQPPPPPSLSSAFSSPDPPDHLYQSVRLAAILYSRAVMRRRPVSAVAQPSDFLLLWRTMWRVPLTAWKGVLGVFGWIVAAIVAPAARGSHRHGRFVKSLLANSLLQIGVDNWELARGIMEASGRLQEWLAVGEERLQGG